MGAVLEGIRVFDFGRYVAGPWCAQLLAGLGADVVRIERPTGGEDREIYPLGPARTGALFLHCNRGKRAVTLDVTSPDGREVVRRLVDRADVIVANLPDASLTTMGLDWPTVHAANPRTVLATVSTFGTTGPYAGRLGFDGIAQAMSGAVHLAGPPGRPTKSFVPWVDFATGSLLAAGTLAALLARSASGEGQRVEGALLGTALAFSGYALTEQAVEHPDRVATGNRHPAAGPSDVVATRDGHLIVQVIGGPMFRRWCRLVGRQDLADDPRLGDDLARGRAGEELSAILAAWCAQRTTAEALAELEAAEIPAGPVLSPQQVLDDRHVASTWLEAATVDLVADPVPVTAFPFGLSSTPPSLAPRAPALGEHTDEVLAEVGYAADDIAALRAAGIV